MPRVLACCFSGQGKVLGGCRKRFLSRLRIGHSFLYFMISLFLW